LAHGNVKKRGTPAERLGHRETARLRAFDFLVGIGLQAAA